MTGLFRTIYFVYLIISAEAQAAMMAGRKGES